MMKGIQYFNRITKQIETESVWKENLIRFFYGQSMLGKSLLGPLAKSPFFSKLVGLYQSSSFTKSNVQPFIEHYNIDATEFEKTSFDSFNDFFIRKLKPETRPIASTPAIIPADGRYLFYENLSDCPYLSIKGEQLILDDLLQENADLFEEGTAILGRLCPTDYHRFHFPIDCIPSEPKLINGWLFSVNPIALKARKTIFFENKRVLTMLKSDFGDVAMVEFGATNVGSITETFQPGQAYKKGDEKGYFSFGGSALLLLFQKGKVQLEQDLLNHEIEVRCLLGQPLATTPKY